MVNELHNGAATGTMAYQNDILRLRQPEWSLATLLDENFKILLDVIVPNIPYELTLQQWSGFCDSLWTSLSAINSAKRLERDRLTLFISVGSCARTFTSMIL